MVSYIEIARMAAQELGVYVAPAARSVVAASEGGARAAQIGASHTIEMAPIAEVIKSAATNPEAHLAAKAVARFQAELPRAIGTVETGEKAPPLVDLVRELAKGGKYDGAVVSKQNGTTMVNFEDGVFKGTQAIIDDSTILVERGGRLSEHSLIPHQGFKPMSNHFVNG